MLSRIKTMPLSKLRKLRENVALSDAPLEKKQEVITAIDKRLNKDKIKTALVESSEIAEID